MTTRDQIVAAADELFYQHGFEHTSFTAIASAVKISRGNFYHHFKSKDEILDAVIEARLASTRQMLEGWESQVAEPEARIQRFIHILIQNQTLIMSHGCPVGTLCMELGKLDHASREHANELFLLFKRWLARQFAELGRKKDADALALHLLGRSQGVATMAQTFRDASFVRREVRLMDQWLQSCASPAA
ncbi:TetR/AcrR family transcriptional regulator [Hydrogenophaga sp.]|uniref:TetR/AcrR family transcriptional regulator n=1 Tax=Hydrogenophaga sp. TaxID=1904254 RepID=UPI002FCBD7BC